MIPFLAEQRRRNTDSREAWDLFAPHRRRVTALLSPKAGGAPPGGRSLCVLGAGNCNDLDLNALSAGYAEIHLADWDGDALAAGVSRQSSENVAKIQLHPGRDLSGIAADLAPWSASRRPSLEEAARIVDRAGAAAPLNELGPFDTVASICLLSQLIDAVVHALGEAHPQFLPLVTAVRLRHLQLLLERTKPGGVAVLVTDFVSSATAPEMPRVPEAQFESASLHWIRNHNFFTGLNPFVLRSLFQSDPSLAAACGPVVLRPPWLWNLGPRHYAVCAIEAVRSGA